MENLDAPESNVKVLDSAYSTSCSNSQSRRSSKSTHSGSHSSGSSGYGGKLSTSGSSNHMGKPAEKRIRDKDGKKKKQLQSKDVEMQTDVEFRLPEPALVCEVKAVVKDEVPSSPTVKLAEKRLQKKDKSTKTLAREDVGFSCVISMQDGLVMYTTPTMTTTLGYPIEMWMGRSFIDFIHPSDHSTFASQVSSGMAVPKKNGGPVSTMFCRIRKYRGLVAGFGVKNRTISCMPFMIKISFKNVNEDNGMMIYLIIQATPLFSAFKTEHEVIAKDVSLVMRHLPNGSVEYVDHESVPFLGYLPQDLIGKDVLKLYHPADLEYMRQVYETIMKERGAPRSKPYRLMTQNGNYLKLETEWSSFINPWSRKLEFVTGKHHVIEGPDNPDVFQPPITEKISDEDKNKAQELRDSIVGIMNEVLSKPAKLVKQQMTKRCQDLASFLENLMEESPKVVEELRLEIQDHENINCDRDSVMLVGISPHHEYSDGKSSTATPLSYNQLNFNENLQRYFNSNLRFSYEEYKNELSSLPQNDVTMKDENTFSGGCMSPVAQQSGESVEMTNSGESSGPAPCDGSVYHPRLTESLLIKHNSDMEKTLVLQHRECRLSNKGTREKASMDTKKKKQDHLARCNASFLPGSPAMVDAQQPHGVKRASMQIDTEASSHKHHCAGTNAPRWRPPRPTTPVLPPSNVASASVPQWPQSSPNVMNPYMPDMGVLQQVPIMNPVNAVSGLIPTYYVPTTASTMTSNSEMIRTEPKTSPQFQAPPVQYMMYGQLVFGSPFMVSPINPQPPHYSVQHNMVPKYPAPQSTLGLATSNYEAPCHPSIPPTPGNSHAGRLWCEKRKLTGPRPAPSKAEPGRPVNKTTSASKALKETTEVPMECSNSDDPKTKENKPGKSAGTVDQTDGESSYSSFYSSFFKTESGSAEESGESKKGPAKNGPPKPAADSLAEDVTSKNVVRRKREPPWVEQVCVTSELIYKYQIVPKNMDEVLSADKQKMASFKQPSLVNEQLGQLYIDMELEGVAARLTLEDGITSSSSSGDESNLLVSKDGVVKRESVKREYSKLVMIYEEDAPFPPGGDSDDMD